MQFKRQYKPAVAVDITPLIDIVFLLLIFFMVSTTFTQQTQLSLDLAEATGETTTDIAQSITIAIDANGHYQINGRRLVSSTVDTVMGTLQQLSADNAKLPLIISADATAPHQAVITAMDAAGQLGFEQLSLTTKQPLSD
ncbi:biopolymer transporter ExbD [uncultured Oceanicoccus sp.]|uniref:ExbD/TolR family protein n=1 Tax=uncultured Oceanicoccus sp. TaxID=1706381 RepID=UPI0030DD74F2